MDIKKFKAGSYKQGYRYKYFLPEKVNHLFVWTDETIKVDYYKNKLYPKLGIQFL